MAYKHVIRAKTKNLFDISKAAITERDYYFVLTQGETSNFYAMTVTPGTTYTVSYEIFVDKNDTGAPSALELSIQTGTMYKDGTQIYFKTAKNTGIWERHSGQFTVPSGINQVTFTGLKDRFLYRNFMVQEGSTATPYTPYNYLQSNKRMIKVSNVCQLVPISDKADGVANGVTFTNNHNGTWTLSGTSTANYSYYNLFRVIPLRQGHIYLNASSFGDAPQTYVEIKWINKDGVVQWSANPYTADENSKCSIGLLKLKGSVDTVVLCPQLFDLTEMFGSGHEPATVAEFRQKFPDELYPYSPQCWLTSYQSAVVCKTKNLFDYKTSAEKTQTNNGITLTLNADYFELSGQQQTGKYIELGQSGFNIPFEIGKTYVLSADTIVKSGGKVFMRARYTDGESPLTEWETVSWNLFNGTIVKRFTPTRPGYFDKITFYNAGDTTPISGDYIVRIQLEQGSTATSYVPYQHL